MANNLTLTAPIALIKVNGQVVGRARNIEVRETFRRVPVYGIGEGTPVEIPFTQWSGTVSCGFYETKFTETGMPGGVKRNAVSKQEFIDNVVLDSKGIDIVLFKREEDTQDPNTGLRRGRWTEHLTVRGCFLEGDGMDLTEAQLGGHNQNFSYKDPVLATQPITPA